MIVVGWRGAAAIPPRGFRGADGSGRRAIFPPGHRDRRTRRIAKEGSLPVGLTTDPAAHDAWFRAKVLEALDDPRPPLTHDLVESHFAQRRAAALLKATKG
jgi:hypothetical protein